MADRFSENDAFYTLGINNFSEVTGGNFVKFASIFNQLDPECQKKALDTIPAFIDTAKEALASYQKTLNTVCVLNNTSMDQYYAACHKILDGLNILLANDTLTFDEKKIVIDYIMIIERNMSAKDTENKQFLNSESEKTRSGVLGVLVGIGILGLALFGVSVGVHHSPRHKS